MNLLKTLAPKRLLSRSESSEAMLPTKIVQFGTGNFLHGFVNWIVHRLNLEADWKAGVVEVKLRDGSAESIDAINAQDGLYTLNIRGLDPAGVAVDQCELIECLTRAIHPYQNFDDFLRLAEAPALEWITSNSTEAGIQFKAEPFLRESPAETFPGKLTQFLYHRFKVLGDASGALLILPCELIEDNGQHLQRCVEAYVRHWELPVTFNDWLTRKVTFCDTLVDRIVSGEPNVERVGFLGELLPYIDAQVLEAESYHLWALKVPNSEQSKKLSEIVDAIPDLNLVIQDDLYDVRQRKVLVLNGVHTASVLIALNLQLETVYDGMQSSLLRGYMHRYWQEVPTALFDGDCQAYIKDIENRFNNPFLDHQWRSIALNSVSKWRARLLPALAALAEKNDGSAPKSLLLSLAVLVSIYTNSRLRTEFNCRDDLSLISYLDQSYGDWQGSSEEWARFMRDDRVWLEGIDAPHDWLLLLNEYSSVLSRDGIEAALRSL